MKAGKQWLMEKQEQKLGTNLKEKAPAFCFLLQAVVHVSPYLHVITPLKEHAGSVPLEKHCTKLGERGRTSVM